MMTLRVSAEPGAREVDLGDPCCWPPAGPPTGDSTKSHNKLPISLLVGVRIALCTYGSYQWACMYLFVLQSTLCAGSGKTIVVGVNSEIEVGGSWNNFETCIQSA